MRTPHIARAMCARRLLIGAAALLAGGCAAAPAVPPAAACQLVLAEHRSGRELARVPLDPARPSATVAFTHSVLGTPVADRYEWRDGRAHLVEERFEGDGYGLPNAAGPGESMTRDGDGWRLRLDRIVHPLVLQPVQGMRVSVPGRPTLRLQSLGTTHSIALRATGCATPPMH